MLRELLNKVGILRAPAHATKTLIPRYTITSPDGDPYLTRWYLFRSTRFRVFLHKFHRSDDDRALHDHPWPFVTILLHGLGYFEHTPEGVRYCPPFSVSFRPNPARPHRVELERHQDGSEAKQWTLFIAGRNVRKWGFHVPLKDATGGDPLGEMNRGEHEPSKFVEGAVWVSHDKFLGLKFDGVEGAVLGLQED